jgi:hypothetical protein
MMWLSSFVPPSLQASQQSASQSSDFVSPKYLVIVVGARNRGGNGALWMVLLKT